MPENTRETSKFNAIIIDPLSDRFLAKVCLEGETFPTNEWISDQGNLQSFEILDEKKGLWDVWVDQRDVFLRTEHSQRIVKIATYPTDGENQGFLNYISDVKDYQNLPSHPKSHSSPKKRLSFLRTLFGV